MKLQITNSKKDELIKTALKLFCNDGFGASGIDKILREADVSKMTLYKYFKTKDELIIATLNHAHDLFMVNVIEKVDALKILPTQKILKFFDMLWQLVQKKEMVRCLFINASAEFPSPKNPINKAAVAHKLSTEKYFKKLLKEAGVKKANYLARILTTLSQGALVMAQVAGDKTYYLDVKKAVTKLLEEI
jgi:AcrR family transcriptional regulator